MSSLTPEQIAQILPNLKCRQCDKPIYGLKTDFCSVACKNRYYQGNSYIAQKARGLDRKVTLIEAKGGGCCKCGYNKNIAALDFHHRDPSEKKFRLDARNISNRSLRSLLIEVEKCDLLCANCHREEHNPGLNFGDHS